MAECCNTMRTLCIKMFRQNDTREDTNVHVIRQVQAHNSETQFYQEQNRRNVTHVKIVMDPSQPLNDSQRQPASWQKSELDRKGNPISIQTNQPGRLSQCSSSPTRNHTQRLGDNERYKLSLRAINAKKEQQQLDVENRKLVSKAKEERRMHEDKLHQENIIKFKMCDYTILREEIGKGMFGTIYKAIGKLGEKVAAKHVDMHMLTGTSKDEMLSKLSNTNAKIFEKPIKAETTHPNVVTIFDILFHENQLFIMMEHCDQDLDRFFNSFGITQTTQQNTEIMIQISEGLRFLHSQKICHRDVKPQNILVNRSGASVQTVLIKLSDYGLSEYIDPDLELSSMSTQLDAPVFWATELYIRDADGHLSYSMDGDIFSTGLVFLAMLQHAGIGKLIASVEGEVEPFYKTMSIGQMMATKHFINQPQPEIVVVRAEDCETTKLLKRLIFGMLRFDPQHRPAAADVSSWLWDILNTNIVS